MMKKQLVLGIDTSNYTTSVSALTLDGALVCNLKRLLPVKPGERGLRQSEAVFAHTVNIPLLMQDLRQHLDMADIVAVGVSEKPRNQDGSYMPCFLSGVAVAESVSATLGVPLYRFSHQCGHIMAAIYSTERFDLLDSPFAAFHISGGTTELVRVSATDCGFNAELLGGTNDINAGQIIDRVGVYMGFAFPAGPALEECAAKYTGKIPRKKISSNGMTVNLSGLENISQKLYNETKDISCVSAFVLNFVAETLAKLTYDIRTEHPNVPVLYAGGVMSNQFLQNKLKTAFIFAIIVLYSRC